MSYIKQQWKTGDVISAEKLNHIESGLEAVDKEQGPAGITPQLQNSGTAIQVSYNEGESYSDLVQLSEITGPQGPAGEGFAIYKTYASVTDMEADAANVEEGKFVMIASSEDDPDNAKLYVKAESGFNFVTDLSGAQGIQGPQGKPGIQGSQGEPGKDGVTPVISVEATQLAYDQPISVVKSGTDAEPHFTFGIPAGQPGKDAELPNNLVTYSDFTYGDQQRKTIQLANYDSISGLGTDGTGYNIAMVSKWDKVDLGAAGLTMNLNSKDGQVQINDEKIIATIDQIPDVSGFATKEELQTGLDSKQAAGDYALKSELITPEEVVASEPMQDALETVRSEIPTMEEIATSPEVTGLTDGLVTEDAMNLALEAKQDKGDYALKSEIPDVSDFATHTEVTDGLATKQDKGDYATNEVVQAEFESYDKTIKTYVDSKLTAVYTYKGSVANEQALPAQDQTVGDVYNVEDTGKNVAWDGEKWDELGAAVDLSAYAKTEDVNAQLATKANQAQVDTLASDVNNIGNVIIPEMNTNTAKALATKVDWDSQKKVISLPMDGSISALRDAETLEGGVLIAQRSYDSNATFVTEVGTTKNKLTLNASERPQIDIAGGSSEKVAFQSDIPDVSGFATTEQLSEVEEKIPSIEGLATETALTEGLTAKTVTVGHVGANVDTVQIKQGEQVIGQFEAPAHPVKVNASLFIDDGSFYDPEAGLGGHPDYFNNVAWSGGDSLSEEQLAQGPFLLITGTNTTASESEISVLTNLVSLGKDSALGKFYANKEDLAELANQLPVEIKLPIRTGIGGFQDKLYTQEEIFAWFGVTDLSGFLTLAKSTRQVWISYVVGASFKTSAYRYLTNYIEYVPSSQSITVIWVGPDSANADVISKFVFKANLDQTVISGASNVQLTVTSIE